MKRFLLASILLFQGFAAASADVPQQQISQQEVLQQINGLVEQLVIISQELSPQKQQEFQMVLQQLLQIFMAVTHMPFMQEELEELIKTKISPTKYTQLQKLQKTLQDKLEKATAPLQKERDTIDKKLQTLAHKIISDNSSVIKQIEALQAQIQVEVEQYLQSQAALQANAELP